MASVLQELRSCHDDDVAVTAVLEPSGIPVTGTPSITLQIRAVELQDINRNMTQVMT